MLGKEVAPFISKYPCSKFQQDNAPCHTSKIVSEFFRSSNLEKIPWPASSPDLNIIENVWSVLKSKLRRMPIRSKRN